MSESIYEKISLCAQTFRFRKKLRIFRNFSKKLLQKEYFKIDVEGNEIGQPRLRPSVSTHPPPLRVP